MGFSTRQIHALRRSLNSDYIRTRQFNGRELSYVEAWHVIAEANRIFGFDGWDRETLESRCVLAREIRGSFHAFYIARVRISVHAAERVIVREGHGTGESRGANPGEMHDMALKAA
jgi:recombination DNA repair RAD52 pathway protein